MPPVICWQPVQGVRHFSPWSAGKLLQLTDICPPVFFRNFMAGCYVLSCRVNYSCSLQVWQEPSVSSALGHQKGFDHGIFHWIHVADYLPVLRPGFLVWLQSCSGHGGILTGDTSAGNTSPCQPMRICSLWTCFIVTFALKYSEMTILGWSQNEESETLKTKQRGKNQN